MTRRRPIAINRDWKPGTPKDDGKRSGTKKRFRKQRPPGAARRRPSPNANALSAAFNFTCASG
jgi:hypothetical protein